MKVLFDENFEFRRDVGQLIESRINFDREDPYAQIIYSEDYMDEKIIRIRLFHLEDVEEGVITELRNTAQFILDTTLRGFPEITKVFTTCSSKDCTTHYYDKVTGKYMEQKKNWIVETDGVALQKVLAVEGVDPKRTSSNSIIEIFQVLGIEAAR